MKNPPHPTPSPANLPGPAPDALPDERKEPASPVPVRTERRVDTTQRPEAQAQTPKSHPEALQEPEARLPHERDEATDMTGGIPSREVRQAYEDVTRGLTDTDKGRPCTASTSSKRSDGIHQRMHGPGLSLKAR